MSANSLSGRIGAALDRAWFARRIDWPILLIHLVMDETGALIQARTDISKTPTSLMVTA